jgi:nitric oxide reductase large subunit
VPTLITLCKLFWHPTAFRQSDISIVISQSNQQSFILIDEFGSKLYNFLSAGLLWIELFSTMWCYLLMALWSVIKLKWSHEEVAFMMALVTLYKGIPEKYSCSYYVQEEWDVAIWRPERESFLGIDPRLHLGFPIS